MDLKSKVPYPGIEGLKDLDIIRAISGNGMPLFIHKMVEV